MSTDGPSISITIPTIGRPTLLRVLREIQPQLSTEDEVLVVGDGPRPAARAMVEGLDARIKYLEHGPTKNWGGSQRNFAMWRAKGSYLMSMDDDDRFSSTGLSKIRKAINEEPGRPLMFKMHQSSGLIWEFREVRVGDVSSQMMVVPNVPDRLGLYGNRYTGDIDFMVSTLARYPEGALVWRKETITLRGEEGGSAWNEMIAKWKW